MTLTEKHLEGGKGVKERRLQIDRGPPKCQRFFMCLATVHSWRTRTYIEVCTYARGKNTHARTRKEFSTCLWRIHIVAKFNELYLLSICTIIIAKFSSSWWGTYVCRYICTYLYIHTADADLYLLLCALLWRGSRYIGTSYIPIWTSSHLTYVTHRISFAHLNNVEVPFILLPALICGSYIHTYIHDLLAIWYHRRIPF